MKRIACVIVCLTLVATFTGCPSADLLGPLNGGQFPNPQNLGSVVIEGNLYSNDGYNTGPFKTQTEIGDLFKSKIDHINVSFGEDVSVPPEDTNSYADLFVITVDANGNYYAELSIIPAHYSVWVEAFHINRTPLFYDEVLVEVVTGMVTDLDILLKLRETFLFEFAIDDLPGEYNSAGDALIVTDSGANYYVGYQTVGDILHFSSWLPLNFDGFTATMEIVDQTGVSYITALDFDIFNAIDGEFTIAYGGGVVNVNIGFEYETT